MLFSDLNIVILLFFLLFLSIVLNVNTSLHLLLTAELLWITLYIIVLITGYLYNNLNFLSLTFFFLILSAVEFGIGLILILLQYIFLRSISLNNANYNSLKFLNTFFNKINTFKTNLI